MTYQHIHIAWLIPGTQWLYAFKFGMYKPTWELEVIQKLHQESLTIQASMVQLPLFEMAETSETSRRQEL